MSRRVLLHRLIKGKIKIRRTESGVVAEGAKFRRFSLRRVELSGLQAGESVKVKLKLSKRARRALRKAGEGEVKVTAVGADLLDNSSKKRKRIKLRPKRR